MRKQYSVLILILGFVLLIFNFAGCGGGGGSTPPPVSKYDFTSSANQTLKDIGNITTDSVDDTAPELQDEVITDSTWINKVSDISDNQIIFSIPSGEVFSYTTDKIFVLYETEIEVFNLSGISQNLYSIPAGVIDDVYNLAVTDDFIFITDYFEEKIYKFSY